MIRVVKKNRRGCVRNDHTEQERYERDDNDNLRSDCFAVVVGLVLDEVIKSYKNPSKDEMDG